MHSLTIYPIELVFMRGTYAKANGIFPPVTAFLGFTLGADNALEHDYDLFMLPEDSGDVTGSVGGAVLSRDAVYNKGKVRLCDYVFPNA